MWCSTMLSFCWLDFERILTATKQYRDPQAGQLTKSILYFFVRVTWLCMQNSEVFKCPGLENLSRYEKLFKLPNVQNNHTCEINCWCRSLLGDWALLLNTAGQLKAIIPFTRWSIARICTSCWEIGWICFYYDLKVLWMLLQHFFGQIRCTGRITDQWPLSSRGKCFSTFPQNLVACVCLEFVDQHTRI